MSGGKALFLLALLGFAAGTALVVVPSLGRARASLAEAAPPPAGRGPGADDAEGLPAVEPGSVLAALAASPGAAPPGMDGSPTGPWTGSLPWAEIPSAMRWAADQPRPVARFSFAADPADPTRARVEVTFR